MSLLGWFDSELRKDGWWDPELQIAAWWDSETVNTLPLVPLEAAAQASAAAVADVTHGTPLAAAAASVATGAVTLSASQPIQVTVSWLSFDTAYAGVVPAELAATPQAVATAVAELAHLVPLAASAVAGAAATSALTDTAPLSANGAATATTTAALLNVSAAAPYFSFRSLALHFDGFEGSQTFLDASPSGKFPTSFAGTPYITAAQAQAGGTSGYFDGSSGINYADSADWAMGSGVFTLEAYIRPTAFATDQYILAYVDTVNPYSTAFSILLPAASPGKVYAQVGTSASDYFLLSTTTLTAGQQAHIAAVRNGTQLLLWVNGAYQGATTLTTNALRTLAASAYLRIGRLDPISPRPYTGYIDELLIHKGVALYSAGVSFTPNTVAFVDPPSKLVALPGAVASFTTTATIVHYELLAAATSAVASATAGLVTTLAPGSIFLGATPAASALATAACALTAPIAAAPAATASAPSGLALGKPLSAGATAVATATAAETSAANLAATAQAAATTTATITTVGAANPLAATAVAGAVLSAALVGATFLASAPAANATATAATTGVLLLASAAIATATATAVQAQNTSLAATPGGIAAATSDLFTGQAKSLGATVATTATGTANVVSATRLAGTASAAAASSAAVFVAHALSTAAAVQASVTTTVVLGKIMAAAAATTAVCASTINAIRQIPDPRRVFVVELEIRAAAFVADARGLVVSAESKTLIVGAEARVSVWGADVRELAVPTENATLLATVEGRSVLTVI